MSQGMETGRTARAAGRVWLLVVSLFLLAPSMVLLGTAVTTTGYLAFPPEGFTLGWFAQVLSDPAWVDSIVASTNIALIATVVAAVLAVPAALALTSPRMPGRDTVEALLTLPMLVPQIVLGVGLLQLLLVLGVGRTYPGFVMAHTILALPFVLRSVLTSLRGAPRTLELAAADLGAGPWRRFIHVTLPLMRTGLGAGCLLGFAASYVNVEVSMFLSAPELNPLPVKLLNQVAYTVDPGVSAVSTLTVVLAFVAMLIVDRVSGLKAAGAPS
ncbi:ABC transporter permease [Nonomuraea sp. NPDC046802]|uniref:ABC transporter permease n=1 Tax=Nonomuraea sp. NPDC046802 TaxID=3154919 RepID=UPI0033D05991